MTDNGGRQRMAGKGSLRARLRERFGRARASGPAAPDAAAPAPVGPEHQPGGQVTETAPEPPAKTPVKKAAGSTAVNKKAPAKKAPAKTAPAKKAPAKKAPAGKAAAEATPDDLSRRSPAEQASPAEPASGATATTAAEPDDAWTSEELAAVRAGLQAQAEQLRAETEQAESASTDPRGGGGEVPRDEAEAGSTSVERDQERSIAHQSREMLAQVERALERIEDGTYGRCEVCGDPITKARLQAFPRATLCVRDKEREERR